VDGQAVAEGQPRVESPVRLRSQAGTARLRPIALIVIVDIAAPLAAYGLLRSAGLSAVTALLLSGVFPAAAVAVGVVEAGRTRRRGRRTRRRGRRAR
jgi:hypothetical protein